MLQIHFAASNNVAEYEALVHGLKVAKEIGVRRVECFGDSDLIVQQCSGTWDALDANMALYRFHVQRISRFFEGCEFKHVPRLENGAADVLSKLGSSREEIPPDVALEHLRKPSIKPSRESDSIFVPPEPKADVVPMDIDIGSDKGNSGTSQQNPGTVQSDPGTAQPMSIDNSLGDQLDSQLNSGTVQPMLVEASWV